MRDALGWNHACLLESDRSLGAPEQQASPKTDDSWESIALDGETVAALREHRKRQLEERLAAGELWQDSGLVFTDELGRPLNPQTILRRFQKLSTDAGLPPCRLHSIRHAHATALLEAGVPIEVVSKRLRHADISTTLGLYAHTTKKLDREVAEKAGAVAQPPLAEPRKQKGPPFGAASFVSETIFTSKVSIG